jgi:hypothetical protein
LWQVCVFADDSITLRRAAEEGFRRISGPRGRKRSLSVRLHRAAGDALKISSSSNIVAGDLDPKGVRISSGVYGLISKKGEPRSDREEEIGGEREITLGSTD